MGTKARGPGAEAQVLDGRALAKAERQAIKEGVDTLRAGSSIVPGLAVVLVGDDPASAVYVRHKTRAAAECGIKTRDHKLPASTPEQHLLSLIDDLNHDAEVDGILVQLPLPDHIDSQKVLESIAPAKDVDGFLPDNIGRLAMGLPGFVACTPRGCMRLLELAGCKLEGAEALVVGRSNIVGKPMAMLLTAANATVTLAHSRTQNLDQHVRRADVVVAAVGRAEMIRGEWIKPGAVVIDVGMNRNAEGKLVGDVEFHAATKRARAITPVPGGVGPMTIAMLLANTLQSAERRSRRAPTSS